MYSLVQAPCAAAYFSLEERVDSSRLLSLVACVAIAGGPLGMAPALAQTTTLAQASTTPSTDTRVYGVATDAAGTPLPNTTITLTGATTQTTTTDASGAYSFGNLQPGIYTSNSSPLGLTIPHRKPMSWSPAGTSRAYNVSLDASHALVDS